MRIFSALLLTVALTAGTASANVKQAALQIQEIVEAMYKTGNDNDRRLLAALNESTEGLWKQGMVGGNWNNTLAAYETLSKNFDKLSNAIHDPFVYTNDRGQQIKAGVKPLENAFNNVHMAATGQAFKKGQMGKDKMTGDTTEAARILDNAIDNHLAPASQAGSQQAKLADTLNAANALRDTMGRKNADRNAVVQSMNRMLEPMRNAIVLVQALNPQTGNNQAIIDHYMNATRLIVQMRSYYDKSMEPMKMSAVPTYSKEELSRYLTMLKDVY